MKISMGKLRAVIRTVLDEGAILDYIHVLQNNVTKEEQLNTQFPGALDAFIADADDYDFEILTDLSYGRDHLEQGALTDLVLKYVKFDITPDGKLRTDYFQYPLVWDPSVDDWQQLIDDDKVDEDESETCPDCDGSGTWQGLTQIHTCKTCGGTGKVTP